ncbi:hypothetical protein NDI56_14525 [Haloarcula sp. S1CR25-12]|uniref:DUF7344 domain-containing protein n=1 Tax=Haloarcula saliterrae TaxID=2950534 RepID=A0ABU2FED1_9EURY|nr:hypothetical protein [Haloarcula sp. S1CR25-12]MDS0260618.1 hypothetical protein [Haloarcula sp. S1CR25-12]
MKIAQSGCPSPDRHQLSSLLADRRTRRILDALETGPATARDLAVALAADDLDCARSAVSADDREQYRRTLEYNYLSRLTDAGLLEQAPDGLIRRDPTALDSYEIQFPALDEPDHPAWPAAAAVVGRAYRYPLLSLVADEGDVSLPCLADRLLQTPSHAVAEAMTNQRALAVALHHVDLPKLAAVDLLTYDTETRTVAATPETETVL